MLMLNSKKLVFVLPILFLIACSNPNTPQDVAQEFWQSVISNKPEKVVKYSTLTDSKQFDHFSKNWKGYQFGAGKVVIEGDKASVDSNFTSSAGSDEKPRTFMTRLVHRNQRWIVDYDQTRKEMQGGVIAQVLESVNQAGENLKTQIREIADNLDIKLERMGDELDALSATIDAKAKDNINQFAAEIRESIKKLELSIQQALKDKGNNWSEQDRNTMNEISLGLREDDERLSKPSLGAIAVSSRHVGKIQRQLSAIDNRVSENQKNQWHELSQEIEKQIQQVVDEFTADD